MNLNTHLGLAVKKINGDWYVGEYLPKGGDLLRLDGQPIAKLILHLEPHEDSATGEPTGTYGIVFCVKAVSNDPLAISEAAKFYLQEIQTLYQH